MQNNTTTKNMEPNWTKLVDKYWHGMSEETRKETFDYWVTSSDFPTMIEKEEVKLFHARFDPDNQFTVTTELNGTVNKFRAFKWGSKYHVGSIASIAEDFITNIEKLSLPS